MRLRRDRFGEVVRRQLDLFEEGEAELLREADDAERAYDAAERDDAEELYGDYQLVLEAVAERLGEIRDAYSATLPEDATDAYEAAFGRAARKRYPKLPSQF